MIGMTLDCVRPVSVDIWRGPACRCVWISVTKQHKGIAPLRDTDSRVVLNGLPMIRTDSINFLPLKAACE